MVKTIWQPASTSSVMALADAAPAIDLENGTAVLYHASKTDVEGLAHMRRINAETGEVIWDQAVPGSISASPLIGNGSIGSMVFFSAMNSDAGGTIYALDKATGEVVWYYSVLGRRLASPIAIYDEAGGAWLVQGDEGGLLLLEATAGDRLDYLTLDGAVYGSPAAFNDMIVVATQTGQIHGIKLK